jgi:hypothetical protein
MVHLANTLCIYRGEPTCIGVNGTSNPLGISIHCPFPRRGKVRMGVENAAYALCAPRSLAGKPPPSPPPQGEETVSISLK